MGKQQKQSGENALNSNLAGKHIFLPGHHFISAGQRFSGVVTGGCAKPRKFQGMMLLGRDWKILAFQMRPS